MALKPEGEAVRALCEPSQEKYFLPNFQRGFVWDRKQQKALLASFFVDLPIGSILLVDGSGNDFACRKLCFADGVDAAATSRFVLDGQQRLSTLQSALYDMFALGKWEDIWKHIFPALRNRWFVRVVPEDTDRDIFGYRSLVFPEDALISLSDQDVEDFIEYKPILKTGKAAWFHPAWMVVGRGESIAEKQASFVEHAAAEGLVPLYGLDDKKSRLHRKILSKIADGRVTRLQLEIDQSGRPTHEYRRYLGDVIDDIDEVIKRNDEKTIQSGWSKLGASWVERTATTFEALLSRELACISLPKRDLSRAVSIFEALNRGGTRLTVYDLVVAIAARDRKKAPLTARVVGAVSGAITLPKALKAAGKKWDSSGMDLLDGKALRSIGQDWFLNILSLLVHLEDRKEAASVPLLKKEKTLKMSTADINGKTPAAATALKRAMAFMQFRCGLSQMGDMPYRLMLLPIAFFLAKDKYWSSRRAISRLEYWYWASMFSGRYQTQQNERCIEDVRRLGAFIDGKEDSLYEAEKIFAREEYSDAGTLLRRGATDISVPHAVTRSIEHYIISRRPLDLLDKKSRITADGISSKATLIESHHIVPLMDAAEIGESTRKLRAQKDHILNSPLNLTPILRQSNNAIQARAPSVYLKELSAWSLADHLIPAMTDDLQHKLLAKDYVSFLELRFYAVKNAVYQELKELAQDG